MPQTPSGRIAASVTEFLRAIGRPSTDATVTITVGTDTYTFRVTSSDPQQMSEDTPAERLGMSPTEVQILAFLRGRDGWTTGESIADALGESYQVRFKTILTNLVDAKVLLAANGRGYKVNPSFLTGVHKSSEQV